MTRAFRGISLTISLLAPLLAENNIQNYNEPMDYSKGDVSLQPFNNQTNQEIQPSANYNTQPNSMQTPMPNQNPYLQPTAPIQNNQSNNTQTQTMLNNAKQFINNALNNTKQTITNTTNHVNNKISPESNDVPISAFKDNRDLNNQIEPNVSNDETKESDENNDSTLKPMTNFNAIQNNFFAKNRSIKDNAHFIHYTIGDTFNIRLRYAMTTTFIFDEPIAQVVLGDDIGFSTKMLGEDKEHLISNILLIKPLQIGVDSNLTIIGKSGKVYSFYVFSTTYTSSKNPALMVYVSSKEYFKHFTSSKKETNKEIKTAHNTPNKNAKTSHNAPKKIAKKLPSIKEQNQKSKNPTTTKTAIANAPLPLNRFKTPSYPVSNALANSRKASENFKVISNGAKTFKEHRHSQDEMKYVDYSAQIKDDGKFIRIGDNVNHIYINKKKMEYGYVIIDKKKRKWYCLWMCKKVVKSKYKDDLPTQIFNDEQFTYFKFNRSNARSKFPVVYKVVDGYDNPVNSRVVGDYLIAEDVSNQWNLKLGKAYLCIEKITKRAK
ncbi:TrbG/VirB9 family P-type conjugative transfer protein [Helicobacter pylori]|uniref:TrbG/VirB9 family P-type conjugative transfer protein n=1 Tax=Helicobacter pylori TaxID=210 RepID=UPI0018D1A587|nr:TrbG/VirB9 family P-type conjugative transfer protein [Helicobacter pylori]MBH0283474.1 TrbG/VirB9 family P-type conjugative transfer protein [Helicobacter pylori]MBH0287904.1 TrbG/VirB9 family P-type conjugative transfer protein [Helicobacter pylori]MBH0290922.1 TrbG/VirB9 family P-type conjugative transfer protein [Helicobacter pylori]